MDLISALACMMRTRDKKARLARRAFAVQAQVPFILHQFYTLIKGHVGLQARWDRKHGSAAIVGRDPTRTRIRQRENLDRLPIYKTFRMNSSIG